jgi:hypothetical protein
MEPIKIIMTMASHRTSGGIGGGNTTRQVILRHQAGNPNGPNDALFDMPAHGMINVVLSEVTENVANGFKPGVTYEVTITERT